MSTVTIVYVKSEDKKAAADAAAVSDAAARSSPGERIETGDEDDKTKVSEWTISLLRLTACSSVFAAMFSNSKWAETAEMRVEIDDFEPEAIGAFVQLAMYPEEGSIKEMARELPVTPGLAAMIDKYDAKPLARVVVELVRYWVADGHCSNSAERFAELFATADNMLLEEQEWARDEIKAVKDLLQIRYKTRIRTYCARLRQSTISAVTQTLVEEVDESKRFQRQSKHYKEYYETEKQKTKEQKVEIERLRAELRDMRRSRN